MIRIWRRIGVEFVQNWQKNKALKDQRNNEITEYWKANHIIPIWQPLDSRGGDVKPRASLLGAVWGCELCAC